MNILTYHKEQKKTAQSVQTDLEDQGKEVLMVEVEDQVDIQAFIDSLKDIEENRLYILQPEDHAFFYTSELLKAVYYSWTDRTRLRWVQPSHFTEPQP